MLVWLLTFPKCPWSITHPLLIDFPKTILNVDQLGFATGWPVLEIASNIVMTHWSVSCCPYRSSPLLLRGCRLNIDLNSSCSAAKLLSALFPNVSHRHIVWLPQLYTCWTHHCGHRSHRSHRSHRGHHSPLSGWVRFRREETLLAPLNHSPQSVGCPDARCVRNASGTLRTPTYEGLSFDCYRLMVDENGIRIVVAPGLIRCCDEPVAMIDWLCLSLRWHVAYRGAASPNQKPCDDVLYKDSV